MAFLNNLSGIPEWDAFFKSFSDEGRASENNSTRSCRALYEQWTQIVLLLKSLLVSIKMPDDSFSIEILEEQKVAVLINAHEIAAKIRSSAGNSAYVFLMESATFIRAKTNSIKIFVEECNAGRIVNPNHGEILYEEISVFRNLFKEWVLTFRKDEFDDEWGLFV